MVDLIDRKLLYELNWNARQTHTALAKKLHISKQVVRAVLSSIKAKNIKKIKKKKVNF